MTCGAHHLRGRITMNEFFIGAGGNQPHSNIQPYTTINFCIALSGIFPSRE
jgi:microcystin-dependent protein